MSHDVFTFGEAMLRFSVAPGNRLETAPSLDIHVAGAEANVAVALARIGRRVAWSSRLPEGPLGRRVIASLSAAGVDCSEVIVERGGRIGVYFVELHAPPHPSGVVYDRAGSCFAAVTPEDVPWGLMDAAQIVHVSGITPALSRSCLQTVQALVDGARRGKAMLSFDVNYRSKLWTPSQAASVLSELVREVDLLVCTSEDAREVFAIGSGPKTAVRKLAQRFEAGRVVVTDGADGAWWLQDGELGHVPSIPASIVDRIGAGDAFTAGVLDGLLEGDLEAGVRRGCALAAIALATRGDQVVTTRREMESLLEGEGRRVDR